MRVPALKTKPVVITKDTWVADALTDDRVAGLLLLHLKHAETVEFENIPWANQPLLRWGFRQKRSRPSRFGVGVGGFLKKETDSARASPMTPLCWSGGSGSGDSTSPSAATVDRFEDNSRQASCSTSTGSGSKVTNEISSSCSKRLKQNKVQSSNVQAMYKERNIKNQSLKRIKLEYSYGVKKIPISKTRRLPSSISSVKNEQNFSRRRSYTTTRETSEEGKGFFFLPDLNMAPTEEEEEQETLYGTS